ncbi:uncharacterized protein [Rutidosis leptorrhynchoides]|uniref:uncharacterized protein n=1 Tax=Rutidosis leptorrhynchoides TaxID=125765 RepID=UPI003A98F135
MLDALLKSKFYAKCKSEIKMTLKRIEIIKRKRNAMQKFLKNDVADLLQTGLDSNAYDRVEQLYADQILSSCYEFVELSCAFILSQLSAINKQRECPDDCKEAISTLMFAAARFADLPELREIRSIFAERYGNYFEAYVNQQFVRNLKADPPSKDLKLQMLQDIALDSGIQWDCKPLELKLYRPPPSVQDRSVYANGNKPLKTHHHQNGLETSTKETEQKTNNKQTVVQIKDHTPKNSLPYKPRTGVETKEDKHKDPAVVNSLPYKLRAGVEKKEEKPKGPAVVNSLPNKLKTEVERREEKLKNPTVVNRFTHNSTAEVETIREEKRDHGRVSPYWSSNVSSSGETVTSPEYSTGPDEDIPEGRKLNTFRSMASPYTKTESNKKLTNANPASSSGREDNNLHSDDTRKVYGLRSMGPPYTKTDLVKKSTTSDEENISGLKVKDHDINKPVARSMRNRRPFKQPVAGSSRGDNDVPKPCTKHPNGQNVDLDHDHNHKDDEERKMDRLLTHYSRKPTQLPVPTRTGSLPLNTRLATEERKGLARASTYQMDSDLSPQGHVHPKLPDYDDFVARLAALRASS